RDAADDPEASTIEDELADMVDDVDKYRAQPIDTAVEMDHDLMLAYLQGVDRSIGDIQRSAQIGTRDLKFCPTYCGSAFKNKGIQLVLDAVIDYLPAPTEVEPQDLTDEEGNPTGQKAIVDPKEPLRALAFKIRDDRFGALTFVRIY